MLNRATNTPHNEDEGAGLLGLSWQVDQYPLVRLALLFAVIIGPLTVVGWRVFQLQFDMAGDYAREYSRLTERTEEISSLTARILTSDGQIAAQDVPGLQVHVHYRWIEEPPDPRWMKSKLLARLPRAERRKPERIREETEKFLAERTALWNQLAEITGVPSAEMQRRREAIQYRVTQMKKRVAESRARAALIPAPAAPPPKDWKEAAKNWFVKWVAHTPEYKAPEEIVLTEELAYYPVVDDISRALRAELKSHSELYPTLRVMDVTRREYPLGSVAPHVVGFRKALTQEEWEARKVRLPDGDPLGYLPGDRIGQTGIEKYYERHLRGVRGERKLLLNSQGEIVEEREIRAPRPGRDLELTLNLALQRQAETLLATALQPPAEVPADPEHIEEMLPPLKPPQSGCIAVMDVRNGELLVAAAWPTFDINVYLNGSLEERRQIEADPRFPLFPRLHKMELAPGSVFKALTATAMLQAGIRAEESFYCQGYLDTPNKRRCMPFVHQGVGHADVNLSLALAKSCNVYFFHGAREMGGKKLLESAAQFGFGHPTGIDLPNESDGNLPAMPCDHLGVAIGQAALTVTPLQILRMMGAIANGGELLTPRLARRSGSAVIADGDSSRSESNLLEAAPSHQIPNLSSYHLEQVRHGLEQVVALPQGTGFKTVRLTEVRIAGKTGTAEARGGQDHAWFAGFVPAEQPKYAFVVVLERGGAGGKKAGPIAKQLVQAMLHEGLIEQSQQVTQLETAE